MTSRQPAKLVVLENLSSNNGRNAQKIHLHVENMREFKICAGNHIIVRKHVDENEEVKETIAE
ncbi:12297_t:CDS:1, partial [Acaulospora colombiana]